MQIGQTRVIIRPALLMIFAGCAIGVGGIAAAGWYAMGTRQTHGLANPKRWTFGLQKPAQADLTMLTKSSAKDMVTTRTGYSNLNLDAGISVAVNQVGKEGSSVYMRNTIGVDKDATKHDLTFRFDARSPKTFPVIFTIRDAQIKNGGTLLWSKTFTVQGDWKTYRATIPLNAVEKGKMQYMILAGHLGTQTGNISLRNIYLK